jgi:hypothetical protein
VPDHTPPAATQANLNETVEGLPLTSRISDLHEIPVSFYMTLEASCLYARGYTVPLVGLSELATQHTYGIAE